jgi:hypothetical protein
MLHHTEISFVDEFQWVSPLHYSKKRMTERCSLLVHVASGAAIFTLLLRRLVAFHMSATLQTMSITVVNLQDNRAVFRIFIALLKFSLDSPSYQGNSSPSDYPVPTALSRILAATNFNMNARQGFVISQRTRELPQ